MPEETNVLDIELGTNDADARTVRDYLKALLMELWREEESFGGKRPFGNSGWQHSDVLPALIRAGAVKGKLDAEGYAEDFDEEEFQRVMLEAIGKL